MSQKPPANSEIFSQIETIEPSLRVVLLGASNLSIMFPTIVETARALFAQRLELIVAKGFGRSYGQQSKFFGKKFSGILQTRLWDALDRARPLPTVAIMADIGNDLAYGVPADILIRWVRATLDRLESHGAQTVLNNVPLTSLRTVGPARYHLFRELFFPSCRLSRAEMLHRAEQLSDALDRLASSRKTPVFAGEIEWYGLDPIHPRRAASGEIWRRMLGELASPSTAPTIVRPTPMTSLQMRRLRPESWVHFGFTRRVAQPVGRLSDGTTIALY